MPLVVCVFLTFNTIALAVLTFAVFRVKTDDMPKSLFRVHIAAVSFGCIYTTSSLFVAALAWQTLLH